MYSSTQYEFDQQGGRLSFCASLPLASPLSVASERRVACEDEYLYNALSIAGISM